MRVSFRFTNPPFAPGVARPFHPFVPSPFRLDPQHNMDITFRVKRNTFAGAQYDAWLGCGAQNGDFPVSCRLTVIRIFPTALIDPLFLPAPSVTELRIGEAQPRVIGKERFRADIAMKRVTRRGLTREESHWRPHPQWYYLCKNS